MSAAHRDAPHIAFCGGGSGGHIVPSLAILEALRERTPEWTATFLCSAREVDQLVLRDLDSRDRVVPLPMRSSRRKIRYALQVVNSVRLCRRVLQESRPDVILGTGGFASLPGVLAGHWCGVPIALLEPNAVMGRANLRLAGRADTIFRGWKAEDDQSGSQVATGVPVMRKFFPQRGHSDSKTLLITGGSLGASRLNQLVLDATALADLQDWKIVHQTGPEDFERVRTAWARISSNVTVTPFLANTADALCEAGLVIARCGAVTLAEIAATETPSVLVPLGNSADDHQKQNAVCLASVGAAEVVGEDDPTALADLITRLIGDETIRQSMASAARCLSRPQAAAHIAHSIEQLGMDRTIEIREGREEK